MYTFTPITEQGISDVLSVSETEDYSEYDLNYYAIAETYNFILETQNFLNEDEQEQWESENPEVFWNCVETANILD